MIERINTDDFRAFVKTQEDKALHTLGLKKSFKVRVIAKGLKYYVASSETWRNHSIKAMNDVLDKFAKTNGSYKTTEYNKLTHNASYTLALIGLYLADEGGLELFRVRTEQEKSKDFSPSNLQDERQRILTSIVHRQGRDKFRKRPLAAYNRRCAVTGFDVVETLEAAHIIAYLGPQTDVVTNGLLLRPDIHTLFDLHLITVDPQDYHVIISKRLKGSCYGSFDGKVVLLPAKSDNYPSKEALKQHLTEFRSVERHR